jgi:class 3 adenylate cyclase/tetratricopeptide (TPR) repeat protein
MIYIFGDCELDEALCELRHGGVPVKLEPKAFKVLAHLIEHRDRVVTKDELLTKLWPGQLVTEFALTRCIAKARQAVHDDGVVQRAIKTLHGHGYRFVAAVEWRDHTPATDAKPGARLPIHGATALASPSPMYQAATTLTGHLSHEGERKQITVLAAGVHGITVLAQMHDPETLHEMHTRLFDMLRAEVQHVEGLVSQATGEGLVALFGVPIAQEDHALRALHAALGMQSAFAAFADELRRTQGITPALRLGVHSGPVMVTALGDEGRLDYGAQGFAVYLAHRLRELASDGTIYVSEAGWRQATGFFRFNELGEFALPEVAQPVRIYACTGVDQASLRLEALLRRHVSVFLGRAREMELLNVLWTRVCRGQGQVVCLVGEPGVGKSRLAHEFQRTLTATRILRAQTLSYGPSMPYHPFIPLLRTLLDLDAKDAPPDQRQQIRTRLHALHPKLADDDSLLALLLGVPLEPNQLPQLPPEEQRRHLQDVCLQLLIQQATDRPLCLLIEDLYWLDPSSQELLDRLVVALARFPILLLGTSRPGFHHTWGDLTYFHRLTVEPLADEHIDALISDYFQPHDASPALKALIRERTGGNPFFVEELLRALHDQQLIALPDDVYVLKAGAHLDLPSSVHRVLAARIDRLPLEAKHLLQTAAVIGREVPLALLQAMVEAPEEALHLSLRHLQTAEFLHETQLIPDSIYTFKHALTQEVAYGSLLQERRRTLHARIMEALETLYCDRLVDQVERLAYHALRSEVWVKAVAYLHEAGAKAAGRLACREAMAYFEQALEALAHLPEIHDTRAQAVDLRLNMRAALVPLREFDRLLAYLREAETLVDALNDQRRLGQVTCYLANCFTQMGDHGRAIEFGQRALAMAMSPRDFPIQVQTHYFLGQAYYYLGDYPQAMEVLRQNAVSLDGALLRESFSLVGPASVNSREVLVRCLAEVGAFAEGIVRGEEAVRIAEASDHPYSCFLASLRVGELYLRKGDLHQAIPLLERSLRLCQAVNLEPWFPPIASALGLARILSGQVAEARPLLDQTFERATFMTNMFELSPSVGRLSEAFLLSGRIPEAIALAGRALEHAQTHKERGHEAWALRLHGEIAARCEAPRHEPAEDYYRQALALAQELGMRPVVAHCHFGLGTLYVRGGLSEQARAALSAAIELYRAMEMTFWLPQVEAAIYGEFTEGSDTRDFRDAKVLGDSLA